jgi:hypothetical protein
VNTGSSRPSPSSRSGFRREIPPPSTITPADLESLREAMLERSRGNDAEAVRFADVYLSSSPRPEKRAGACTDPGNPDITWPRSFGTELMYTVLETAYGETRLQIPGPTLFVFPRLR